MPDCRGALYGTNVILATFQHYNIGDPVVSVLAASSVSSRHFLMPIVLAPGVKDRRNGKEKMRTDGEALLN